MHSSFRPYFQPHASLSSPPPPPPPPSAPPPPPPPPLPLRGPLVRSRGHNHRDALQSHLQARWCCGGRQRKNSRSMAPTSQRCVCAKCILTLRAHLSVCGCDVLLVHAFHRKKMPPTIRCHRQGTLPEGSTWALNPMPYETSDCLLISLSYYPASSYPAPPPTPAPACLPAQLTTLTSHTRGHSYSNSNSPPEFTPPCNETVDRRKNDTGRCSGRDPFDVMIVDSLIIPATLVHYRPRPPPPLPPPRRYRQKGARLGTYMGGRGNGEEGREEEGRDHSFPGSCQRACPVETRFR